MAVPASSVFPTVRLLGLPQMLRKMKGGTAMTAKKKSRILGIVVILLLLCEAASLAVLFSQISKYSEREFTNIIPLTESTGTTVVKVINEPKNDIYAQNNGMNGIAQLANPSFSAYDEKTVWQAETDVEIFRISYENDENKLTVKGQDNNGDKIIAPGTSNKYVFTLANTGDVPLMYNLNMESWITGTDFNIPVEVRVWNHENTYISGSSSEKVPVLELNNVNHDSILGTGRYDVYTLEWEWPFEQGNDEFDTMLGNLAVEDDLELHIRINTTASYSDDPDAEDSGILPPKTGDRFNVKLYVIIIISAILILIISSLIKERKSEESV